MKQFNPKLMIAIGQASVNCNSSPTFGGIIAALTTCDVPTTVWGYDQIPSEVRADTPKIKAAFIELYKQIEQMGLDVSASTAKEIADAFDAGSPSARNITKLSNELCKNLKIQMGKRLFYSIDLDKQHFITDSNLFGDDVANDFPSAAFDIVEAGMCLAFDRWIASVFHSMKVLEIGLQALAKNLGVPFEQQTWERVINDIEAKINDINKTGAKTDLDKKQFYSQAAVEFRHFKNAWRNHVMHVRATYGKEQAENIFEHTKQFMAHLATELKE